MPVSLEQLDLLLLTIRKARRVRRDGIRFLSLPYIDTTLAAFVGEWVNIRYDPRDLAEIRVFHHDRFLCRAVCQELAGETVTLKDIIKARNERRRTLQQALKARRSLVDQLLNTQPSGPSALPAERTPAAPPRTRTIKLYEHD